MFVVDSRKIFPPSKNEEKKHVTIKKHFYNNNFSFGKSMQVTQHFVQRKWLYAYRLSKCKIA